MYYKSCFVLKIFIKDKKYNFKNINIINCNNKDVSELYTSKYTGSQNYKYENFCYFPYSLDFNDNRKYVCQYGNCSNCLNCLLIKLNNIFLANKINFIYYEPNAIKKEKNLIIGDAIFKSVIINRRTEKNIDYNLLHIIDNRFNLQNVYLEDIYEDKLLNCIYINDTSFDNIFNIVIEYAKNNNLLIPVGIKSSRK